MNISAFWDENTRSKLRMVAEEAGLWMNSEKNITFLTGTEAALLQADYDDPSCFEIGDDVLVADYGGHLVEIVTYQIQSKSLLRLVRWANVSVGGSGAGAIGSRFHAIVRDKIIKRMIESGKYASSSRLPKCRDFFRSEAIPQSGNPITHLQPFLISVGLGICGVM
ncbi:hypothetical protein N7490_007893 [Penicillium lividum]|nr:hypothetical protein N7490_007893 [Penicillium lividum]